MEVHVAIAGIAKNDSASSEGGRHDGGRNGGRNSLRLENGRMRGPAPSGGRAHRVGRAGSRLSPLPALGLTVTDVDDVSLMVSELATNVLQHAIPHGGCAKAELWVYQRGDGNGHDELVVKAFDTLREWRGAPEASGRMREHGRGLEIIDILARDGGGTTPRAPGSARPPSAARPPGSPCRSRGPASRAAAATPARPSARRRPRRSCARCSSSAA